MAVKGKNKSRGQKRQVTRAPKPQYTPPPQTIMRRRWVQVTGAFVAGILAVLVALWAITGISHEAQARDHRNEQADAAKAMRQVQAALSPILSQIGQQQGPGFDAFPRIRGTITAAQKGGADPDEIALTATTTQKTAKQATESIARVSTSDLLGGSGASQLVVTAAIDATDEMAAAFTLYEQAAVELARSHDLSGAKAQQALASAKELDGKADALFQAGYNNYTTAQEKTGVLQQPAPPAGGLTGGLPGAPAP